MCRGNIPVIVLSGVTEQERIEQVRQRGAVAFLAKPVDEVALLAAVASALRPDAGSTTPPDGSREA
jgi:FixJ family two-component response regulator